MGPEGLRRGRACSTACAAYRATLLYTAPRGRRSDCFLSIACVARGALWASGGGGSDWPRPRPPGGPGAGGPPRARVQAEGAPTAGVPRGGPRAGLARPPEGLRVGSCVEFRAGFRASELRRESHAFPIPGCKWTAARRARVSPPHFMFPMAKGYILYTVQKCSHRPPRGHSEYLR